MSDFFGTISAEAVVSTVAVLISLALPTTYYVLPVFFGLSIKKRLGKIFEPPIKVLYSVGRFSLWIIAAIVIACVVPIIEQMELLSQVCEGALIDDRPPVCGEGLVFSDFVRDSHVHTLQMMIWLLCAWMSWVFFVLKVRSVAEERECESVDFEEGDELSSMGNDGFKDIVMANYYSISGVFLVGATLQQYLERFLI